MRAVLSRLAVTTAATVLGLSAAGLALAAPPPLAAYGRLPTIEDVALSSDGARLGLIVTDGDKRRLVIQNLADSKVIGGIDAGTEKVRWLRWAGSNHLLVGLTRTAVPEGVEGPRQEYTLLLDYNVAKRTLKPIMNGVHDCLDVAIGEPMVRIIDGRPYVFAMGVQFVHDRGRFSLFKVDLDINDTRVFKEAFENTDEWLVDADGELLAESEYDSDARRWTLRLRQGQGWRVAKTEDSAIGHPVIVGLGRDGRSVLLSDNKNEPTLHEFALDGSDWGAALPLGHTDVVLFDTGSHVLIGGHALVGDQDVYDFLSPADQATWKTIAKGYGPARTTLTSLSDDHRKLVVEVDSPTEGPAYALVDLATRTGVWIGDTFHDASQTLAPVTPFAFKAADGTALTGYLTLPRSRPAKDLPLVVFPHGGPAARDEPGFDWWAQAMASRGYAVLQVNYRGSDGFGWTFMASGFGQWGRAMQTDLSDGVRALAVQGVIDAKRVCIVGASYGGYAALAGAALQPGVYRCAASVAGPSDLKRMVIDSSRGYASSDNSTQRFWLRFMGADGVKDPDLAAISPARLADQVKIPILLIHGKDDTVVPYVQSTLMADALTKAGKPVELVTLPSEDHWLSRGATRLQMLTSMVGFLEKNNPPD